MRIFQAIVWPLMGVCSVWAQSSGSPGALSVEYSVPFGVIPGKLLLLSKYLVFIDEQQLTDSFVVPKAAIENLNADGPTITVQSRESVRNRSGEVTRLSFRVLADGNPGLVTAWYGSGGSAATAPVASTQQPGTATYQARHNHRFGDCHGRLIVAANQLSYESVTDVDHSRRWEYTAIREIKLPNPYELEVKPSTGGDYKFFLEGSGMDPGAFKSIVDRVTTARSAQ